MRRFFPILLFTLTLACGELKQAFAPPGVLETSASVSRSSEKTPAAGLSKSSGKTPVSGNKTKRSLTLLTDESPQEEVRPRTPIVTKQGAYYFVKEGDALSVIARKYGYTADEAAQINDLYDAKLTIGRRLFFPARKTRPLYITKTVANKEKKLSSLRSQKSLDFVWPVEGGVVTSAFGWRRRRPHDGVDISAKVGTPIHAAAEGKVIFAKRFAGYGNLIVLKHRKSYFTAYAHADNIMVDKGRKVQPGQQIATVGNTGRSTGPHLHFEIRRKTDPVDPLTLLPKKDL